MDLMQLAYRFHMDRIAGDLKLVGLTRVHYRCLYMIRRHPGIPTSRLGRLIGTTKQSSGRALDTLLARRYVAIEQAQDRRFRLLQLTDAGMQLEEDLSSLLYRDMARACRGLSQEAVSGFWQVMQNLLPLAERRLFAISQPAGVREGAASPQVPTADLVQASIDTDTDEQVRSHAAGVDRHG